MLKQTWQPAPFWLGQIGAPPSPTELTEEEWSEGRQEYIRTREEVTKAARKLRYYAINELFDSWMDLRKTITDRLNYLEETPSSDQDIYNYVKSCLTSAMVRCDDILMSARRVLANYRTYVISSQQFFYYFGVFLKTTSSVEYDKLEEEFNNAVMRASEMTDALEEDPWAASWLAESWWKETGAQWEQMMENGIIQAGIKWWLGLDPDEPFVPPSIDWPWTEIGIIVAGAIVLGIVLG